MTDAKTADRLAVADVLVRSTEKICLNVTVEDAEALYREANQAVNAPTSISTMSATKERQLRARAFLSYRTELERLSKMKSEES